jgi:hypothetical protein
VKSSKTNKWGAQFNQACGTVQQDSRVFVCYVSFQPWFPGRREQELAAAVLPLFFVHKLLHSPNLES